MPPLAFLSAIPTKVWIAFAIIAAVAGSVWMYGSSRYEQGVTDEQIRVSEAHAEEIAKREEENKKLSLFYEEAMEIQRMEYRDEINQVELALAAANNKRLRVPAPHCSAVAAGQAEANSPEGGDDPTAGTVLLPEQVDRDLRELMAEAERIVAACRVGQKFIRDNKFEEK